MVRLVVIILGAMVLSGCVVAYAPEARQFSLYTHNQYATNMVINQDISEFAKASAQVEGTIGASIKGTK